MGSSEWILASMAAIFIASIIYSCLFDRISRLPHLFCDLYDFAAGMSLLGLMKFPVFVLFQQFHDPVHITSAEVDRIFN